MGGERDHLSVEVLTGTDRGLALRYAAPGAYVLGRAGSPDLRLQQLTDPSLLDCHLQVTVTEAGNIRVARLGDAASASIAGRPFEAAPLSSGGLVKIGNVTIRLTLVRGNVLAGEVPRARLSQFRLVEEIGEGAFSRVYAAVERATGRNVALKRLRVADDSVRGTLISAFLREIQTTASLDHPGIARVLSAGRRGDDLFLVMEFVDGPDLDACVRIDGPLPEDLVRWIARKMLEALAHAHAHGVIHRDVKPSNVMLRSGANPPEVVLVDFGLAIEESCQAAWGLTVTGDFRGTPAFAAPECLLDARGHSVRSDLFGVGATLYYALTGRACRPGASADAFAPASLVPLAEARPETSPDLARLVDGALALDPADRWPSAKAMLRVLDS